MTIVRFHVSQTNLSDPKRLNDDYTSNPLEDVLFILSVSKQFFPRSKVTGCLLTNYEMIFIVVVFLR